MDSPSTIEVSSCRATRMVRTFYSFRREIEGACLASCQPRVDGTIPLRIHSGKPLAPTPIAQIVVHRVRLKRRCIPSSSSCPGPIGRRIHRFRSRGIIRSDSKRSTPERRCSVVDFPGRPIIHQGQRLRSNIDFTRLPASRHQPSRTEGGPRRSEHYTGSAVVVTCNHHAACRSR